MKRLIAILLLLPALAGAQKLPKGFDLEAFNKNAEIARWLCEYDHVAWITSDSTAAYPEEQKLLGSEWFCYKDNNVWHALYGKLENGSYKTIFHFTMDSTGAANRINEQPDTALANAFARCSKSAMNKLFEVKPEIPVRFNQYIRRNDDGTITVYLLPAFQLDYTAVYGGEFIHIFNSTGTKLLNSEQYYQEKFRGFKPDRQKEITIDYSETTMPTLGSIFFAYYYQPYFKTISIKNKRTESTLFCEKATGCTWIHAVRK